MSKHTSIQTAEFCQDCYLWSDEPKVVKLCPLHATTAGLLAALKLCQVRVFMHDGSENKAYQTANTAIATAEGRDAD